MIILVKTPEADPRDEIQDPQKDPVLPLVSEEAGFQPTNPAHKQRYTLYNRSEHPSWNLLR